MTRQRVLVIAFLGMLIVTAMVLYLKLFRQPGTAAETSFAPLPVAPIGPEHIVTEQDLNVLTHPRFQRPLESGSAGFVIPPAGRADPFAPL